MFELSETAVSIMVVFMIVFVIYFFNRFLYLIGKVFSKLPGTLTMAAVIAAFWYFDKLPYPPNSISDWVILSILVWA